MGANTALRDAAALRQALVAVTKGEQELIPALTAYEQDMIEYGFAAVRASLTTLTSSSLGTAVRSTWPQRRRLTRFLPGSAEQG
jgi:2-polyprenyl-6-methoxyphenol hydroxylase-like FAD-dependent oxidoreductase